MRRVWDPLMAAGVPPHLTLAYPEELDTDPGLRSSVAAVACRMAPFRVRLGALVGIEQGRGGAQVAVLDLDGGWAQARQALLPREDGLRLEPHVTIVHRRTSPDPERAWRALRGTTVEQTFLVSELQVTETYRYTLAVLQRYPLSHGRGVDIGPERRSHTADLAAMIDLLPFGTARSASCGEHTPRREGGRPRGLRPPSFGVQDLPAAGSSRLGGHPDTDTDRRAPPTAGSLGGRDRRVWSRLEVAAS
jgi:2'-5' RNA ligase superfamily